MEESFEEVMKSYLGVESLCDTIITSMEESFQKVLKSKIVKR